MLIFLFVFHRQRKRGRKNKQQIGITFKNLRFEITAYSRTNVNSHENVHHLMGHGFQDIEEKYSKENLQKIHDKWRKIMRAAKTAELHKDIEAISECYDHEVFGSGLCIPFSGIRKYGSLFDFLFSSSFKSGKTQRQNDWEHDGAVISSGEAT